MARLLLDIYSCEEMSDPGKINSYVAELGGPTPHFFFRGALIYAFISTILPLHECI